MSLYSRLALQFSLEGVVFSLMNENLSHKRKRNTSDDNRRDRRWVFKREHVSLYRSDMSSRKGNNNNKNNFF